MIARLAYLTTPGPDRFVLNIKPEGGGDFFQCEISKAHLANIIITGASLALREQVNSAFDTSIHRVPISQTEGANDGSINRT